MHPALILAAILVAAAMAVFALLSLFSGETSAQDRLRKLEQGWTYDAAQKAHEKTKLQKRKRQEEMAKKMLEPLAKIFSGGGDQDKLREQMVFAGIRTPGAMSMFLGVKAALCIALPVAAALYAFSIGAPMKKAVMMAGVSAVLGMRLPNFWLAGRVKKRQAALRAALPDTLDLMVVCVEAGLGLDAAVNRISDELSLVYPEMSAELGLVNLEMRAGASRAEALRHLGARTGVDDIKSFCARLVQSDRFGTSIAKSLRTHADALRNQRRQRAEQAAAKTTVKLLFPLVFFIFPALFAVLLGPAAINVINTLGHG